MKVLLLVLTLGFFVACSSSDKKETTTPETTKAATSHKKADKKAAATTDAKVENKELKCKKNADERPLSMVTTDGLCEVKYIKNGKQEPRGKPTKNVAACEATFNRVKSSLEAAGFKCE